MRTGSPSAKQILWHAILGAAVCFVGFWLADIAGILAPSLSHASAEKWMLMAVACGYCSVGAALDRLGFSYIRILIFCAAGLANVSYWPLANIPSVALDVASGVNRTCAFALQMSLLTKGGHYVR